MKQALKTWAFCISIMALFFSVIMEETNAQQRRPGARPVPARPAVRPAARPAASPRPQARPYPSARPGNYPGANNRPNYGGQGGGNRRPININVNYSNNIKIYNTRNTIVRRNVYRPAYARPPYRWGRYRYHCHRPYFYHPYRPYYWGPRWRPWGFFITALAATAIIVSFADADLPPEINTSEYFVLGNLSLPDHTAHSGPSRHLFEPYPPEARDSREEGDYYYDEGVFYLKGDEGYTVVAAPVGGIVKSLPEGYETVYLDEERKVTNYYFGGAFYEKVSRGFKVVEATAGVVVSNLPEGGEEVKLGDVTYVKLGETYYQPIQQDGKNVYEVVSVEEDK
jgi:hypothetical protein